MKKILFVFILALIIVINSIFLVQANENNPDNAVETVMFHSIGEDGLLFSPSVTNYLFVDNFENGLNYGWMTEMCDRSYAGMVSTKYAREGTYSYRMELRHTDPFVWGGKRSEISIMEPEPAAAERIYQFSVYLPSGGDEDYAIDPEGDDIIAQWHNIPDPGEDATYPPLALHTRWDGRYLLTRCWDADPLSSEQKMDLEGTKASYDLGSYLDDKGKWVDWTFHIKWGWLASQYPMIRVYKDGNKVFELIDEPNTTNDEQGTRMQIGIYKWEWGQSGYFNRSILTNRVIYFDNIIVREIVFI